MFWVIGRRRAARLNLYRLHVRRYWFHTHHIALGISMTVHYSNTTHNIPSQTGRLRSTRKPRL